MVPRLQRILTCSEEAEILQSGCEALGQIVKHDFQQLLQWYDGEGKSGLEVTLVIIDRLLRPEIPDNSALEVGGLAAEVVEKVKYLHLLLLPEPEIDNFCRLASTLDLSSRGF